MPYLRDRAIILRSTPFREHDRKVVMFGAQHGLMEAVARGASAKEAKQGGHVVPFTEAEVLIAKGAAFDKLAVSRTVRSRPGIRRRLGALTFAGAFSDLFERLQRPGIVDMESYALLSEALDIADALPDEPSAERTRLLYSAAALKLLDRIGFAPPLSACASCREGFATDGAALASEAVMDGPWLLPVEGSFLCPDCYRTVRRAHPNAEQVPAHALSLLRFLRREPLVQALRLTGTAEIFRRASLTLSTLLQQAPLTRAPHGGETIFAILG